MTEKGITVGLGTDAFTNDMLESMKAFLLIQRHNAALPNVAWDEAVTALFDSNVRIAAKVFRRPLGALKAGAAADVVIMDYPAFTPFSEENADGHILFGMTGKSCRTTIVNGKVLYKDRAFTQVDEERMNAWTLEQSKKLWGELNHREY
jgi:cytosine/adenosine deaminase-related metal-dependent hydrolase